MLYTAKNHYYNLFASRNCITLVYCIFVRIAGNQTSQRLEVELSTQQWIIFLWFLWMLTFRLGNMKSLVSEVLAAWGCIEWATAVVALMKIIFKGYHLWRKSSDVGCMRNSMEKTALPVGLTQEVLNTVISEVSQLSCFLGEATVSSVQYRGSGV